MRLKRRQMRMVFLLLLSLFAYSIWINHNSAQMLTNEDFIRLHVVANSNLKHDQELKLIVRDGLIKAINNGLVKETMIVANANSEKASLNIEQTKEYIKKNLTELEKVAKNIIEREGYDYPVSADLGVVWIPKKTYDGITFPAGNYEALNVKIGEGEGENWWCVLFPPLCLIETDDNELYKEVMLDDKYRDLIEGRDKPKTLKLKFKVLELFN
ncbi:MAG: stage II sporulation protein R [Clostridiales bacterium]|jgi:stage II sporulation protein R|nr:stage II sporulation protein R [Clostridiales bacterium]